jgi:hypothetical protein
MAFDLSSATPVEAKPAAGGFDLESATPADAGNDFVGRRTGAPPQKIEQAMPKSLLQRSLPQGIEGEKGVLQSGLNMAIGAITAPVAGMVGVADVAKNLLQGKDFDTAMGAGADISQKIQQKAGSLVPQNQTAQNINQAVAKPLEMAKGVMGEGARYTGEAFGMGPKGQAAMQSAGEALPEVAATLFGGGSAMKAAKAAGAIKPQLTLTQRNIQKAVADGYTPMPVDINPTMRNKVGTVIANPDALADSIAVKNAKNTTRLAKEDLGLAPTQDLSHTTVNALKKQADKHYTAIQELTDIQMAPDQALRDSLGSIDKPTRGAADAKAAQPEYYRNNKLEQIRAEIVNPAAEWTPAGVLEHISNLRADATKLFNKSSPSLKDHASAKAMRGAADSLEDFLSRKLQDSYHVGGEATAAVPRPQNVLGGQPSTKIGGPAQQSPAMPIPAGAPTGMPQMPPKHGGDLKFVDNTRRKALIDNWEKARTLRAKIHNIEESTNLKTEHVDPAKLSKLRAQGMKLTGGLEKIADAHETMGDVVKSVATGDKLRAGDTAVGNAVVKALRGTAGAITGAGAGAAAGSTFGPAGAAVGGLAGLVTPLAARKIMSAGVAKPSVSLSKQVGAMDKKKAAALAAASASRTNSPLPPPMAPKDRLTLE